MYIHMRIHTYNVVHICIHISRSKIYLRLHDITEIQSTENAFAARRGSDGAVIAWGGERDGGLLPTDMELRVAAESVTCYPLGLSDKY